MRWQVCSAAKIEAQGARTWPSLLCPNKRLSIRTGLERWGDRIRRGCGRSQAHQSPLMITSHRGDIPLGAESDNAESTSSPSGDFKGPRSLPDAIAFISSWKCEMQWGSTSSPGFSAWLWQWFAGCPWKSQLRFCCLGFLCCAIQSCSQA